MNRDPEKRYWYEVIAEAVRAEEVSDCFALLGDANMHMATHLDALGTRMIHVRHELFFQKILSGSAGNLRP